MQDSEIRCTFASPNKTNMEYISLSFFCKGNHIFTQYLESDVNLKQGDVIYLERTDKCDSEKREDLALSRWKVKKINRSFKYNVFNNENRTKENPFVFKIHNTINIDVEVVKHKKVRFFKIPDYRWNKKSVFNKLIDRSRMKDGIFEFMFWGISVY